MSMDAFVKWNGPPSNRPRDIGIIGTSGRLDDKQYMSIESFIRMVAETERIINEKIRFRTQDAELKSGGASFADHVAVILFLKSDPRPEFELELPAPWDHENKRFKVGGMYYDRKADPGLVSNRYHSVFSDVIGRDSLKDIDDAIKLGAKVTVSDGFFARNMKITKVEYMIAMTFNKEIPKEGGGGTTFTWNKTKTLNKFHVNIHDLMKPDATIIDTSYYKSASEFLKVNTKENRPKKKQKTEEDAKQ